MARNDRVRGWRGRIRRLRHGPEDSEAALGILAQELPDEDIGDDLDEQLDAYRMGSKPRCEEVEYLWLIEDAQDRMGAAERDRAGGRRRG